MAASGELAIVLDPAGYKYAKEAGIAFAYDGNSLRAGGHLIPEDHLWAPPGSPWIMPALAQFGAEWWKDPLRYNHLVLNNQWDYWKEIVPGGFSEIEHVDDWVSTKNIADTGLLQDTFIGLHIPPVNLHAGLKP